MCPSMEESMVATGPHWILGVEQGMVECWPRRHCHLQPWWWCMTHIRAGEACGGAQRGDPFAILTKLFHQPETCLALDVDQDAACT